MAMVQSERWVGHVITHYDQTCGDLILSKADSSLIECALLCSLQMSCYMFELFLTNVCDVFSGISPSSTSTAAFETLTSRVVYKGVTNCQRSGYTYNEIGHLCLKNMKATKKYDEAQKACEMDNGRLPVLPSNKQIEGIRQYMIDNGITSIFIGMTDRVTEGLWKWTDGTPFDKNLTSAGRLNNYDSQYPNDMFNADCAELSLIELFDVHCDTIVSFICERSQLI